MNNTGHTNMYSHFELSGSRNVILAHRPRCALATAPKVFPYGPTGTASVVAPHRAAYTAADAQAVCDMLNERLKFSNSAAPIGSSAAKESAPAAATPSIGGGCGVSLASVLDASASEFDRMFTKESYR